MATKRVKTPIEARNIDDMVKMPRDNVGIGDWSLMTDGFMVWLGKQKLGERPTAEFEIPKRVFDRFIGWYTTGEWRRRKKKAA